MADHRTEISISAYSNSKETCNNDTYDKTMMSLITRIKTERTELGKTIGFTCSSFDLFHPGHVIMLEDSKRQCDLLVVGIQTDPTLDRPGDKNKPIQSFIDRKIMISSCKYIDVVVEYTTENDLHNILTELKPDIRILGMDWRNKRYTGYEISEIRIY